MESTETKNASTYPSQSSSHGVSQDGESMYLAEMVRIAELCKRLEGMPQVNTEIISAQIQLLSQKRRTSAKYRREVENSLYSWITDGPIDGEFEFEQQDELSECQAAKYANWVVGVSDRRVREPILKRVHVAATSMSAQERARFLDSIQSRLLRLIGVVPSEKTAGMSSILALVAWQGENQDLAQAAVVFGRSQDSDNVLLQLVAGAVKAGLPTSAWEAVMDEYSLTQLRSG